MINQQMRMALRPCKPELWQGSRKDTGSVVKEETLNTGEYQSYVLQQLKNLKKVKNLKNFNKEGQPP